MSLIKHHIDTLHLRADAPFPSDLREMVAMYKEKHSEKRSVINKPDRNNSMQITGSYLRLVRNT